MQQLTVKQVKHSVILILFLAWASGIFAQAPSSYVASETQGYRLKVAQDALMIAYRDVALARQQLTSAQQAAQQAETAASAEVAKVREENKWPAAATIDLQNQLIGDPKKVTFVALPAPPTAAAKPDEPAKKP